LISFALLPAAQAQKNDDEITIVFPALWNEALDPILSSGSAVVGLAAIYDDLIGSNADGSALSKKTGVIEDWEMSADGKVWTFKVRKGVKFHRDFGELTAEDIKFTIDRLSSPRSVTQMKAYFQKKIGKVEVVDLHTVRITASGEPIPDLIITLSALQSSPERFVVSKKAVESLGEEGHARMPVGSGPYEFVKHVGGQSVDLKAVADHWRIGKPRFARARFLAIPEEETAIAMLQQGQADLVPVMRSNIKRLEQAKIQVILQKSAYSAMIFLDDQFAETVPVHKAKVREAMNLAIDRKALVDTLFEGHGQPIGTYWAQSPVLQAIGYDWKADLYPHDPKKARALLAEAGYPNGFAIDVYVYPWVNMPEAADTLQAVAGMWGEIGIKPNLIPTEYGVVRSKMLKGEMPGAVGYFPIPARPWQGILGSYRNFMHSTGAFNHVKIAELDKILDEGAQALDPEVAKTKLKDAMHYVRANNLAVPLLEYDLAFGVSRKARHWDPGFIPNSLNFDSLFGRNK